MQLKVMEEHCRYLESQINDKYSTNDEYKDEMKQLTFRFTQQITYLQSKIKEYQKVIESKNFAIKELDVQFQSYAKMVDSLSPKRKKSVQDQNTKLKKTIADKEIQLAKKDDEILVKDKTIEEMK